MTARTKGRRAGKQQAMEHPAAGAELLGFGTFDGALGNAFTQQLLRGELDAADLDVARRLGPAGLSELLEVSAEPAARSALETLAELEPSEPQLRLAEALDGGPLAPQDLTHLADVGASGTEVEELEALGGLAEAGAPVRDIGAQMATAGEPRRVSLPFQAELEAAFQEDLSGVKAEVGAGAALGPMMADAVAEEDGVLRFADDRPDKSDVVHEVVHHLQAEAHGQGAGEVSSPDQAGELEAERATDAVLRGEPVHLAEQKPAAASRKAWASHAGDFFSGAWGGAKDAVSGLWSMGVGALNLTNPYIWLFAPERTARSWATLTSTLTTVFTNPRAVWEAFTEPFVRDWTGGRPAAAIGRGVFDLLSLLVGAKGLDKLAKGSKLLNAVDDAGRLANKADELGRLGNTVDDAGRLGNTADELGRLGNTVDDAAKHGDDAAKCPDAAVKALDEPATTQTTRDHVHLGETETAPNSAYFGRWNKKGVHTWEGLMARCAQDGFEIVKVTEDPATGARRVVVRRHGVHPKSGEPVSGTFEKTIYPKKLSAAQVDELGEAAFQAARRGDAGTIYDPPTGKLRKNGEPIDGYYRATVRTADGSPIAVEGWFSMSPDGKPAISSHAPRYQNDWPTLRTAEY